MSHYTMERFQKYKRYILVIFIFLAAIVVWYFVYTYEHRISYLKVVFLDIGQGDSIYIEAPNGKQMLVDGGPSPIVLSRLAKVMPWGDHSIDVLLATHTDADHIAGFNSVLDHYKVGRIFENGAVNTTKTYTDLQNSITKHHVQETIARKGMRIILDSKHNVYFDILFPDRDISNFDSNDGSIVGKLTYGNESFMLTGDATIYTENLIMQTESADMLHSQVLKLGHHGSKYSSSELWLENVHPDVAIVSAGVNNRYGHPNPETLGQLADLRIPYIATLGKGSIVFKTDGITLSESQLKN